MILPGETEEGSAGTQLCRVRSPSVKQLPVKFLSRRRTLYQNRPAASSLCWQAQFGNVFMCAEVKQACST
jgi:hypothetical protein